MIPDSWFHYDGPMSSDNEKVPEYRLYGTKYQVKLLQWRHCERDGVSNHQSHDCLLNRLFEAQIKENIKAPRHWPLCGEFTRDRWIPRTKGQ